MRRTPVLIVGAGPVGMVTALELAHHGVRCVLVEQGFETTSHPKVDLTSSRSMELLARLGMVDDIRAAGVASRHCSDVIWSAGLDSDVVTVWRLPSVDQAWRKIRANNDGTQPSQPWQRISQVALEPVMRARCGENPLIDFRRGWRFESLRQDGAGVTSRVASVTSGEVATIRSRYLVGCDGASSVVRRFTGIALEGSGVPELPAAYLVHFKSRDVAKLHRHGPFWHYFAFRYVILSQDEIDTWTLHVHATNPHDFEPPPADPVAFVRSVLGVDIVIDKILLTSLWRPKFLIARHYRDGRVMLAGDAAHQMFPTGAYGMNTGMADGIDIGWKLAALVKDWGGPRLLDSYETERRPVAQRNMAASRRHLGVHLTAGRLLRGGTPLADLGVFLDSARGENEWAGLELGYRYHSSPIVCPEDSVEPEWSPRRYLPTTWPGGRAPSVILRDGGSVYDLMGREFTLVDFAGDGRAGPLLQAAAVQHVPVKHVTVGDHLARGLWERDLVLVRPDHHVAWRGAVPGDPHGVIRRIRGADAAQVTGSLTNEMAME